MKFGTVRLSAHLPALLFLFIIPGCDYIGKSSALTPKEETEAWWVARHEANVEQMSKGNIDLLMIGDSITHLWENTEGTRFEAFGHGNEVWKKYFSGRRAINLGFAGDRTEHVLWRLENLPLDAISPKAAVLLIGTNNLPRKNCTPRHAAEGVQAIVQKLRESYPEMKILLMHVFPRDFRFEAHYRNSVEEFNSYLPELVGNVENVTLLDIGDQFLEADGTLSKTAMPDGVHPSAKGFEIWAKAIDPILKEWLGE